MSVRGYLFLMCISLFLSDPAMPPPAAHSFSINMKELEFKPGFWLQNPCSHFPLPSNVKTKKSLVNIWFSSFFLTRNIPSNAFLLIHRETLELAIGLLHVNKYYRPFKKLFMFPF